MYLKRFLIIFCSLALLFSCENDTTISFQEATITTKNNRLVEINIPIAHGVSQITSSINNEIRDIVMVSLSIGDTEKETPKSIEESINIFNNEYEHFIADFPDTTQPWEAQIDGEVMYKSPSIISMAITSYINTGGAHGNLNISFKNFEASTGRLISNTDLFESVDEFKKMAQPYFEKSIKEKDVFLESKDFELPGNIAYNDEGIILLYNSYDIAPHSTGIIEFTIPYSETNPFLVVKGF